MESRHFDSNLIDEIERLSRKLHALTPVEWVAIGYLFAQPKINKPFQEICNNVNSIAQLAHSGSLSNSEAREVLLKMINNLVNSAKVWIFFTFLNFQDATGKGKNADFIREEPKNRQDNSPKAKTVQTIQKHDAKSKYYSQDNMDSLRPEKSKLAFSCKMMSRYSH